MNVVDLPIKNIKPYKNNPRDNKKAVKAVAASIREFGFKVPIVVDKNMEIVAGHTRYQASLELGLEIVSTLISACHTEAITVDVLRVYMHELLQSAELHGESAEFIINPAGSWTIGGPEADCGVTGRKIVCDQYGGYIAVGGGAFSGKDPTKVDRSASYMARKIAIDLVRKFDLEECEIQLGYAIGVSKPMSIYIKADTDKDLYKYVQSTYDLTPRGIINHLHLYNLDYEKIAEGCHYR